MFPWVVRRPRGGSTHLEPKPKVFAGVERSEEFPPDDCVCSWTNYDDDRCWVRLYRVKGCPVHTEVNDETP